MVKSWANSRSRRFYEEGKISKLRGLDTERTGIQNRYHFVPLSGLLNLRGSPIIPYPSYQALGETQ